MEQEMIINSRDHAFLLFHDPFIRLVITEVFGDNSNLQYF